MTSPPAFMVLHLPGPVVPKARARVSNGHAYTPNKTRVYEAYVRQIAAHEMRGRAPMADAVMMDINVVVPIPPSWPKHKQISAAQGHLWPTGRPDLDNMVKAISDGLNGVAYLDDAQIVRCVSNKNYGDKSMAVVTIWRAEG